MKRILLASVVAAACAAGPLHSETCLSPYIKGLRAPEKVMYLWTLPVGEGADYLSVIDVNVASPTYGKILKKVEVGSKGNEAHHMGYTDRSEEHTSELQSQFHLVCRLLLEKKNKNIN